MGAHRLNPDPPGDVQGVLDSIRRIVRALRESSRRSEGDAGLTSAQLFVLQVVANEPSLSINEVAARTHTHQSSVSVVVHRLAERGLLMLERSATDGRRHVLTLTTRGQALIKKTVDPAQVRLVAAIASLPDQRRQELALALQQVVAAMSLSDTPPEMFFEDVDTHD